MRTLMILLLTLFLGIAAPISAENDVIELTIQCPHSAEILDINFKNHLHGS